MSVGIELTGWEVHAGAMAGLSRHIRADRMGLKGTNHQEEMPWDYHIEGALTEMALAKYLGCYWTGRSDIGVKSDLGDNIEVRSTTRPNGRMIIQPNDKDQSQYWFVRGSSGHYRIVGWLYGEECKQTRFWDDPTGKRAAFFVPAHELRSPTARSFLAPARVRT